jgi:hypothetical protein
MEKNVFAIGKYANGNKNLKVVQGGEIVEFNTRSVSPVVEVPKDTTSQPIKSQKNITLDVPDFMKKRTQVMQNARIQKEKVTLYSISKDIMRKVSL